MSSDTDSSLGGAAADGKSSYRTGPDIWVFAQVMSPAAQDIFTGDPTAFVPLLFGGIRWGV